MDKKQKKPTDFDNSNGDVILVDKMERKRINDEVRVSNLTNEYSLIALSQEREKKRVAKAEERKQIKTMKFPMEDSLLPSVCSS